MPTCLGLFSLTASTPLSGATCVGGSRAGAPFAEPCKRIGPISFVDVRRPPAATTSKGCRTAWSTPGMFRSVGSRAPTVSRCAPRPTIPGKSAHTRPHWQCISRLRSGCDQIGRDIGQHRPNIGPDSTHMGPESTNIGPESIKLGPLCDSFDHILTSFDQSWPGNGQSWLAFDTFLARCQPNLGHPRGRNDSRLGTLIEQRCVS